jgi:hypothetical protein
VIDIDAVSAAALPQIVELAHANVRMIFDFCKSKFKFDDDDYREFG